MKPVNIIALIFTCVLALISAFFVLDAFFVGVKFYFISGNYVHGWFSVLSPVALLCSLCLLWSIDMK